MNCHLYPSAKVTGPTDVLVGCTVDAVPGEYTHL